MTPTKKRSKPAGGYTYKLPEQAIQLLHQLGDDDKLVQFTLGDLAAELVDERGVVPAGVIRNEIAKEHGSEPSTIRDRERVSRLINGELREAHPALRFHQWRAVASVEDKRLIPLIASLACVEWANDNGRPATVQQIRRRLRGAGMHEPSWVKQWERLVELAGILAQDEQAPESVRLLAGSLHSMAYTLSVPSYNMQSMATVS